MPLEILLLLLKHEAIDEDDGIKELLRDAILVHMKHPSFPILKYLVEESYACEIFIEKLSGYFCMLPYDIDLKKYHSSAFPTEEQKEIMMSVDFIE